MQNPNLQMNRTLTWMWPYCKQQWPKLCKPEAMQKKDMKDVNEREVPGSRWCYWRNAQSQSAPISLVLLAIPASCPVSFGSAFANGGTHVYRWWQWRYMLAASRNGGINVNIRPPLQLVSKQTLFRKLFFKKTLYSKFAVQRGSRTITPKLVTHVDTRY